jgi:hypothetical protein
MTAVRYTAFMQFGLGADACTVLQLYINSCWRVDSTHGQHYCFLGTVQHK